MSNSYTHAHDQAHDARIHVIERSKEDITAALRILVSAYLAGVVVVNFLVQ